MTRLTITVTVLAALAFSACGSSNSDGDARIVPAKDPVSDTNRPAVPKPTWPGPNTSSATAPDETGNAEAEADPCLLVSRGAAAEILGASVETTLGAQGPTCIYEPTDSKPQMTLVLEQSNLAGLRHEAAEAKRIQVGAMTGWCLDYGSTSVAAPLPDGRVLHVTGPCGLAARFAAHALGQLSTS
jgi:hypothetical protein